MSSGYLIDTNHLGDAVTPGSVVRERVAKLRMAGARVGTCVPVLCEIEAGIQQVSKPDAYHRNLARLLRQVRVWPIDESTSRIYGEIHYHLRQSGRVLSQVDMMVAALARQMKLTVVTSDGDFAALSDIPTENWLT